MARRIRFLSDQVYETGGPGKGPVFKAGTVLGAKDVSEALGGVEMSDANADAFLERWVRRNVAVYVDKNAKDEKSEPEEKAEEEKKAEPVQQPLGTAKHGRPVAGLDEPKK